MHAEVIPEKSRRLLARLAERREPALRGWTLAGGTGLALHLGHRLSGDFDYFVHAARQLVLPG